MPRCSPPLNRHLHELLDVASLVGAGPANHPQASSAGRPGFGDGGRPLDLVPAQGDHRNLELTGGLVRLVRDLVLEVVTSARER
ncbi:hypothetical protein GCM10009754_35970 [Amycolatopsis minnesotensis]|uniref:Uncharacterized protein n=1 Tax=Amycolatopsis minnesotensis TaxID=337894 RepID=A0ABN2R1A6_9PSEU